MLKMCKLEKEIIINNGSASPIYADLRTEHPDKELPLIVLCHGFLGYKKWGWFPLASRRIAARGFHTLTVSFSMNGVDEKSGRITKPLQFSRNTFTRELNDLGNVLSYIREDMLPVDAKRKCLGLFGHSRGGAVCTIAANRFEEVKSLVTWAAPSSLDRYSEKRKKEWARTGKLFFNDKRADSPLYLNYSYYKDIDSKREEYNLPVQVAKLKIPYLIIQGDRDVAVSLKESKKLMKLKGAGKRRFDIIKGCGHSFGVKHTGALPAKELLSALDKTEEWFVNTIKGRKGCL